MARRALAKGDDGSGIRYADRCLREFAGYGDCVLTADHDGLCRDAFGHRFAGSPKGVQLLGWHGLKGGKIVCTYGDVHAANAGLERREVDAVTPVPAALYADSPEPVDYTLPECER